MSEVFGTYPSGETALTTTLRAGPLACELVSHGASLRRFEIDLPDGPRNVALGLGSLDAYIAHGSHIGATCGRYAGKIPHGRVTIGGRDLVLSLNAGGQHHVHGGLLGLGRRNWELTEASDRQAVFQITSPDGDEGYPGALRVTCTYRLSETALQVAYEARTTQDTPLNLLHHGYFNLDGQGGIGAHHLEIASERIIARDADGSPTGAARPAEGTYDFSMLRRIGEGSAFDDTYLLADAPRAEPGFAARVVSAAGDVQMELFTTESGLHFYDGGKLNIPDPGHPDMAPLTAFAGLCLEPTSGIRLHPDGTASRQILRTGEIYRQITEFRLAAI